MMFAAPLFSPPDTGGAPDGAPCHVPGCIGVDEAGRGCLAGPVVAAAVFAGGETPFPGAGDALAGVTDSKQLSAAERARFAPLVRRHAPFWGLGITWMAEIDERNILQASLAAMGRALGCCRGEWTRVHGILVDGNQRIPGRFLPRAGLVQETVVGGDRRVLAIAAASILAKQFRDALMTALDWHYPGYGFARHKGYATKEHRQALERLGPCPLHRQSFAPCRPKAADAQQGRLC